jgi:hypothetical protein
MSPRQQGRPPKHKTIPNSAIVGERGVTLIKEIVLSMGYLWHPTTATLEAGIDGIIELRDPATGEALNQIIQVQGKAFSTLPNESADRFTYYCDERDLTYWLRGNSPVILVITKPATREAYWISVKEYFRDAKRRVGLAVQFDKAADRFDHTAVERLRGLAVPRDAGLYLAPRPKNERLYTNLLPIGLPPSIYIGRTDLRKPWQVFDVTRSVGFQIGPEWYLTKKLILSFYDLCERPWTEVCDQGTVEEHQIAEWSESEDSNRRNELTALLNQTVRGRLRNANVEFHERFEYYFVMPTSDLQARITHYRSLTQETHRVTFRPYMSKTDPERVSYYRHSALTTQIYQFNGEWFLAVTPTYHYTRDGYRASKYREEQLKGIKRLERNGAVLGQILMWTSILRRERDLFTASRPQVLFGEPSQLELGWGIEDKAWLPNEADDVRTIMNMEDNNPGLF